MNPETKLVHVDVAINAIEDRMGEADAAWGRQVFKLFYRDYVFRGSDRPTGIKYCLRTADRCCAHGLVFGGMENVIAELPDPPASWKIPTQWAPKPIGAFGTCHENERRKSEARGI